jgi:hypothetical protein
MFPGLDPLGADPGLLMRSGTAGLPSGEAVARLVGAAPLTPDELAQARPHGTPLWFHIFRV